MLDKLKDIFKNKDKKVENLVFLLCVLIITLISINYIMKEDNKDSKKERYADAVLASSTEVSGTELERRIENILSKIEGVGKVSVLLTYKENNLEGIIIVAEGTDNLDVKVNIISAVEAVTGLGKHKIKVYEMRGENNEKENQYGED